MAKYRYIGNVEVWVPDAGRVVQPDEVVDFGSLDREFSEDLWSPVQATKSKGESAP